MQRQLRRAHNALLADERENGAEIIVAAEEPLIDQAIEAASAITHFDCKRGCAACCHQPVKLTEQEARRIAGRIADSPDLRERVERFPVLAHMDHVRGRVPCAFLGPDCECLIYEFRPLQCRGYMSTDVQFCESIPNLSDEELDRPTAKLQQFNGKATLCVIAYAGLIEWGELCMMVRKELSR